MNKDEIKFLEIMESQGYTYDENQTGEGIKLTFDDGKRFKITIQEIKDVVRPERIQFEKAIGKLKTIYNGTYRLIYDEIDNWWFILYDSKLDEAIQIIEEIAYDIVDILVDELNIYEIRNYSFYKEEDEKLMLTDEEWLEELHKCDQYE